MVVLYTRGAAFPYVYALQKYRLKSFKRISHFKNTGSEKYSRYQAATAIAILFHAIGLTGILFINKDLFIRTTPYHLLLMGILLFYTAKR